MANERPKAELLNDMVNKHLSVDDVKKRIQELEAEYGSDYFLDYDIEDADIQRKPKQEWNEEYYEQVRTKGILGIASKQYFLYFAELNEYIYNKQITEQRKMKCKKLKAVISASFIAIVLIVVLILCFQGVDAGAAENIYYQTSADTIYISSFVSNIEGV